MYSKITGRLIKKHKQWIKTINILYNGSVFFYHRPAYNQQLVRGNKNHENM